MISLKMIIRKSHKVLKELTSQSKKKRVTPVMRLIGKAQF